MKSGKKRKRKEKKKEKKKKKTDSAHDVADTLYQPCS